MAKIGDVRETCRRCVAFLKGCPGCIVGRGDINGHETEEWECCCPICRDEELAVGRLVQVTPLYWRKIRSEKEEQEQP